MGRKFNLSLGDRCLEVRVEPVDEAWELWLCEDGRRLALGATVAIDKAAEAWRQGLDPIVQTVERIRADIDRGLIALPDVLPGRLAQAASSRTSASPLSSS